MLNLRKTCVLAMTILAVCLVIGFAAANSPAQRTEVIKIMLTNGARSNGYEKTVKGNKTYLKAVNVTDPRTDKLLELIHELEYRCRQSDGVIRKPVRFERGNSKPLLIPCDDIDGEALAVLVVNKLSSGSLIKDANLNSYETKAEETLIYFQAINPFDSVIRFADFAKFSRTSRRGVLPRSDSSNFAPLLRSERGN